jgi:hypothetical protein
MLKGGATMLHILSTRRITRRALAVIVSLLLVLSVTVVAFANVPVTQISSDPYTNTTSQHQTEVEPDSFSFGSTIVATTQVGRFFDGGASNLGWATSTDNGATWTHGYLPGVTKFEGGGPYDRVSDPVVAYDAKHNVWIISGLAIRDTSGVVGAAVTASRSTNGGTVWNNPIVVASATGSANLDKNWIVCDNTPTSPFYGNCYVEWDDNGAGNRIKMSTSSDGGLTWGAAKNTANNATGLGGQPVVQPNGTVIVPIDNANETALRVFRSTNGGGSWSSATTITTISSHTVAGSLRSGPLPSAEIDGAGKVYVVWQDCRFRSRCRANDIVMTTSTNGTTWSAVTRIPIDATNSGVDHFIPGLAVDKSTSGSTAKLGLTYYYYPVANCTSATCQLNVGFISSPNGGASWSAPTAVSGPMTLSWLANTSQGRMVGDYISTSYAGGTARGLFALATAPSGGVFNEAMYTTSSGLSAAANTFAATAASDQPVPNAASDQPASTVPLTSR